MGTFLRPRLSSIEEGENGAMNGEMEPDVLSQFFYTFCYSNRRCSNNDAEKSVRWSELKMERADNEGLGPYQPADKRCRIDRLTYTVDIYSHRRRFRKTIYANDVSCFDQIRMCRATFDRLCGMLTTIGGLTPTKNMLVDETFNRVLSCMMRLGGVLLKTPEPVTQDSTDGRWKWFKIYDNCLGALDGTHIKIRVPNADKPRYRNRKGEISTNVLGVCSQDGQFIYVLTGWEGSAADGRVLWDAVNRPNGLKVPHGELDILSSFNFYSAPYLAPYFQVHHILLHTCNYTTFLSCLAMSQEQQGEQQGGGSSKRPIRLWTPEEDKVLVESMLELRLGGTFSADNGLKPGSYRDLEKKMELKLPGCGIKAVPHIQSRYKSLKAVWKEVFDMFYGPNTSGFGWDPDHCMVTAEKDVWDNYIKSHKKSSPYRTKPFPLFEQLTELFGKDRANGKEAQAVSDFAEDLTKEGETEVLCSESENVPLQSEEVDMESSENPTLTTQLTSTKKQKRRKVKENADEVFNNAVDKICTSMDHGLDSATKELCFHLMNEAEVSDKVDKLYNDLLLINGITYAEVFSAHIKLSSNPRQLLSYNCLPDSAKLCWIKSLLEEK
ncbi:hypothetical protein G2W53_015619 [Senna tora]|uniref:Myb/SANT-like domain-containing protein n=1 Tax=Senna tora TaxID=362788 RepID=A0A834WVK4_9FABA|nr:hypothetical protein G2W53_015619 [Senna tora]